MPTTPNAPAPQRVNPNAPLDPAAFVAAWQSATSHADVAARINASLLHVRRTEQMLRAKGVRLKRFVPPAPPADVIDVDALNAIIDKPGG